MVKLSDFELGWLVGILEGEGYFRYHGTPHVVMATTDEDVIITCANHFLKITGNELPISVEVKEGRKDLYKIVACGDNARKILQAIVPYMHYRRRAKVWQVMNGYKGPKKMTLQEAGLDIQSLLKSKQEV